MMADCGCGSCLDGLEDFVHDEVTPGRRAEIAEHLSCCPPCEEEYRVSVTLKNKVKDACCESAPEELKTRIVESLRSSDLVD